MHPTLEKWIAALRGGEYKQTCNTLFDGQGYCCLGVLEHILIGGVERNEFKEPEAMISEEFAHTQGINLDNMFGTGIEASDLSRANDEGTTFEEIATMLEEAAK